MIFLGIFDDGMIFKEIILENFVEGLYMIKCNGIYYFMWFEGGWGLVDYVVLYVMLDNFFGFFECVVKILQ